MKKTAISFYFLKKIGNLNSEHKVTCPGCNQKLYQNFNSKLHRNHTSHIIIVVKLQSISIINNFIKAKVKFLDTSSLSRLPARY